MDKPFCLLKNLNLHKVDVTDGNLISTYACKQLKNGDQLR